MYAQFIANVYFRIIVQVIGATPYEQLRPGEKSKPVPNLLDPTYQYIAREHFAEPIPDLVFSHNENMRVKRLAKCILSHFTEIFLSQDNYHVLSRSQSVCAPACDNNELNPESIYCEISEVLSDCM